MTPALQGALSMAARGLRVFPLRPNSKVPFEHEKGDDPRLSGGVHIATTDPEQIKSWFRLNPQINYGISTTGLIAIDVDAKKPDSAGLENLLALEAEVGPLPRTYRQASYTGGFHILLSGFEARQKDIARDLQIRSRGGYIVGAGSSIDGRLYKVLDDAPVAPCPEALRNKLAALTKPKERDRKPVTDLDTNEATGAALAWLEAQPGVAEGGRNNTAFRLACILKDKGCSQEWVADALHSVWSPKCDPELDREEIEKATRSAFENGDKAPGVEAPQVEFEDVSAVPEVQALARANEKRAAAGLERALTAFCELDLSADPATLPPIPWLFRGLVQRGVLTGLVAPGGIGKSALTIALGIALALGDGSVLGMEIEGGPQSVLFINNEDDYTMLQRRAHAFCLANSIDRRALTGRLHTYSDARRFIAVARDPRVRKLRKTKALEALRQYIEEHRISMVVLDPFTELHEASENDNTEMAAVLAVLKELAAVTNIACIVVHHTRKPLQADAESYAGNADSARGASAFRGSVRSLLTLMPPSKEDVERYGMTTAERRSRLRLDSGKANYSAPDEFTRWFQFVSVAIGNPSRPDSIGALRTVDLRDQEQQRLATLHGCLAATVLEAGEEGLSARAAAKALGSDPLFAGQSLKALERRIQEAFANPIEHDGIMLYWDRERCVLAGFIKRQSELT